MTTEQDLVNLREQLQDDIITFLDGFDEDILDELCNIVVRNINAIISKEN